MKTGFREDEEMAKDPAFLFYPADWIGGTMGMTFEEKGAYMELLMLQFNRGHINENIITRTVGQLWDSIKDKFIQDENGLWYNERLEFEKIKRREFTESRRNNRKGINNHSHESDGNPTSVYIFKDLDNQNIKIGASVNPENRLSTIKYRHNKNVEIVAIAENCTLADEKKIHKHFEEYHVYGDWFNVSETLVIDYVVNHMGKHMINHMSKHMVNVNVNVNNNRKGGVGEKQNPEIIYAHQSEDFKAAFNEWIKYRKEKKQSLTKISMKKQATFLAEYSSDVAIKILDQSMQNGWTGLFPLKNVSNGNQLPFTSSKPGTSNARIEGLQALV